MRRVRFRHAVPGRRFRPAFVALATAVTLAAGVIVAGPAAAFTRQSRIDLKVLVVSDGSTGVDLVTAQLDREGVPYRTVDLTASGRPAITPQFLAGTSGGTPHAFFQGVVVPNETIVPAAELAALNAFEKQFGLRRVIAYTWANPAVGLTTAWSGSLDGVEMTVTPAAKSAGFGYLDGVVPIDNRDVAVTESYGYLGVAAAGANFTPLVTATAPGGATGSLLGVNAADGREELVVTLAANQHQTHAAVLGHGLVSWLTKGVHLGHWRNWFSVHVDDVFLPDDRWHTGANCTVGDNCPPGVSNNTIRMVPADVTELVAWQRRQALKLDLAYNGAGSVAAGAGDPLTASLLANKANFRWLNHTYTHAFLGCVQDFSVSPWRCATDATGATRWVPRATIEAEIRENLTWARGKGISVNGAELVTGQHSGLRSLPQMAGDNPHLGPALTATGVRTIGSDNSREQGSRTVGSAQTAPRYPMNIFYNVATEAEEVDEYNWIYTSAGDGGSGICANNPGTSTCIAPLPLSTGFRDYIVPIEARIAFDHVVAVDPRPHYAHQSNITEDRVLYPVLDAVLARYRATYTDLTPVVNPTFTEIAHQQQRTTSWKSALQAGTIEAYLHDGRVNVVNRGGGSVDVPVTVPAGTRTVSVSVLGIESQGGLYGEAYGGERTAWKSLPRNGQLQLRLPS